MGARQMKPFYAVLMSACGVDRDLQAFFRDKLWQSFDRDLPVKATNHSKVSGWQY